MDDQRFDRLAAAFAADFSRRRLLGTLAGAGFGGRFGLAELSEAKKKKKKKQKCSAGNPIRCGRFCCRTDQTCRRGRCLHHCEDGIPNFGESDTDCGRLCDGVLGASPFGRCQLRKRCEGGEDCRSAFCEEIEPGAGKVCVECRIDSNCDLFAEGRPRCIDNFCFECSLNSDCAGRFSPARPFCVSLPVAAGLNDEPCPPGEPCVCRECRDSEDCTDPSRPHCQTGTGTANDGECFECVEDTHCPEGSICDEQGRCESLFCNSNNDCSSRCCDLGECLQSFDDNINHCGSCGNACKFNSDDFLTFCFRCCDRQCKQFPRAGNPDCNCP